MPVTVAGSTVIVAAEFIAVWFAMRLLAEKDIPLTGMPIQGTMDMKSGSVSFTAFDATISRLTVCDFVKKWTGVQLAPGPGEWNPTKEPGLYCALEKAYFGMTVAAFTGYHPGLGVGHIDAGLTISPVQFLFDLEFTESLKFLESPKVSKELIGMDTIKEVGFGIAENFTTSMHTIENMYTSSWMPNLINRNGYNIAAQKQAVENAKKKVNELVASYKKPELDQAKMEKAKAVLERAKKDLAGK
jgi:trimethylamine:corrinoid methyltransferase-like protein